MSLRFFVSTQKSFFIPKTSKDTKKTETSSADFKRKHRKPFSHVVDFVFDVVPVGFSWRTSSPIKSCSHIISLYETQHVKRKTLKTVCCYSVSG